MKRIEKGFLSLFCAAALALSGTGCQKESGQTAPDAAQTAGRTAGTVKKSGSIPVKPLDSSQTPYPLSFEIYTPEGIPVKQLCRQSPRRVITGDPSSVNILLELGLKDRIYGIFTPDNAQTGKWAEAYKGLRILGDKKSASKEIIIDAQPDLLLGRAMTFTDNVMGSVKTLNEMGIPVYIQKASNFKIPQEMAYVIEDVRNIGRIFNVNEKAEAYAQKLQIRLDKIVKKASAHKTDPPQKVLLMTAYRNGTFTAFGANSGLQEQMLHLLGAKNVMDKGRGSLTSENLMALNPDIIVYVASNRHAEGDRHALATLYADKTVHTVNAVAHKKIISIPYDALMDYGPKIFDSMEALYAFMYGER